MSVYSINGIKKIEGNPPGFLSAMIAGLHRRIDSIITEAMRDSELEAMVLKGVMLGRRKELPQEVQDMFVASGVVHTLAVSGLHVGLVAAMFFWFFRFIRFPRKAGYILSMVVVILYVLITGARPSAVRAAIMVGAGLGAMILDRDRHIYNIIALAALIILVINPGTLFDVGFQMSFAAVLGILYLMPCVLKAFSHRKVKNRVVRWVLACFAVTAGAQAGVYPIIAFYFNKISLVSLASNIVAVPLVGIIVGLGFVMSIAGFVSILPAKIIGMVNGLFISIFIKYVSAFASLPFAFKYVVSPSLLFLAMYYLFLAFLPRVKRNRNARRAVVVIPVVYLIIFMAGRVLNKGVLSITFLDVKGSIAHVGLPGNKNLLVYGGGGAPRFNAGKNLVAPYLWRKGIKRIAAIYLTGRNYNERHEDTLKAILERFKVRNIYYNGNIDIDCGMKVLKYERVVEYGGGSSMSVLSPEGQEGAVMLKLKRGDFHALFAGEAGRNMFNKAAGGGMKYDVLQLTGSGKKSFLKEILDKTSPKYAIISGKLPDDETSRHEGVEIYSTSRDGAVTIRVKPGGRVQSRIFKVRNE